jgi:hypothetical protein
MLTNFAYEGSGVTNDDSQLLDVPQSLERSLNQPCCMADNMRSTAQAKLDASLVVGNGPDMYDGDKS